MNGRFMDIDYREAGQRMVLDWATDSVIPKVFVARADSCDIIVKHGEKLPGSGPRKCWACGFEWILKPGEPDICPNCKRPNVILETEAAPPETIKIVLKRGDESPQETLERSKELIRDAKGLPPVKLTVGDLSIATAQKNSHENVRQRLRAMKDGLSVGDKSWVTAQKDSIEVQLQREDAEKRGLTVGDLSVVKSARPQPSMSSSQEIAAEIMRKHAEKRREVLEMEQRISELQNSS